MEDRLMDKEQREALKLSKDDLLAKKAAGRPADVARTAPRRVRKPKKDINQLAAHIVSEATEIDAAVTIRVAPLDVTAVQVKGLHFRTGPLRVEPPSRVTAS